ncbi:MAG: glycoside hydrolase family 3 C-terminal domain-containing protein [Prevotella sp.]|nr:glycoside hydrolase family 3 C-terminal domain-containing protein [Prevotella sp.]
MNRLITLLLLAWAFWMRTSAQSYDFHNTKMKDDQRIDLLIRQLTLDEKISLLSTNLGVARLGIPSLSCYEGLHGIVLGGPANKFSYPTTIFPQAYGLGETWDREAVRRVGQQMAEEARYYIQRPQVQRKGLVIYAPNADLARDPRWGRTEESYGEDAYLTGQLSIAMVKGLQGDNPRYWKTAALMKHFLANSNEDGRDSTSSDFDERLFREYYSYPFYKGITEGGSRAFMASYNAWNDTPMCVNPVLDEVARKEWGNNGIICTDGGGLRLLVNAHHAYPTMAEGAAAVIKAKTGMFLDNYKDAVNEALTKGLVTEKDIETAIRGNLFVALKLGLLDGADTKNPYAHIGKDSTATPPYMTKEAQQAAREVTNKSVVLLKNNGILPLDSKKTRKILVVGPYADQMVYDWYSGNPPYEVTILKALREMADREGLDISYIPDNRMGKAEEMAREADAVIVCTGNHPYGTKSEWFFCPVPSDGREAVDRKSLQLPDEDMLRLLYRANPNTVLVLVSSFPYTINWSNDHLPAILHITHCSQEQGHAVADALFGKVNPAGRTTQTWVRDILDLPPMMDYDIRHGRTYMYHKGDVLYPFGYGLSYTTFQYGKARILRQDKHTIEVSVPVTNTGNYDGDEVVQLYVTYPDAKVEHPQKQLKAFERIYIKRGETKEVVLRVQHSDLTYWDALQHAFIPEKGHVLFMIGASSSDIRTEVKGN